MRRLVCTYWQLIFSPTDDDSVVILFIKTTYDCGSTVVFVFVLLLFSNTSLISVLYNILKKLVIVNAL